MGWWRAGSSTARLSAAALLLPARLFTHHPSTYPPMCPPVFRLQIAKSGGLGGMKPPQRHYWAGYWWGVSIKKAGVGGVDVYLQPSIGADGKHYPDGDSSSAGLYGLEVRWGGRL